MEDKTLIKKRIDWFCKNKINAFSPTISPAPKSVERNEIESLYEGILWFVLNGVKEIVIEKKYMGSYCDIYLHRRLEDTYLVSRNGYKINHLDQEQCLRALQGLHDRFSWDGVELRIIQSELMPWSILGKGLINNEFSAYYISHEIHAEYLVQSSLYEKLQKIQQEPAYLSFVADAKVLSAKELKDKYPMHIIRQYQSIRDFKFLDLPHYQQNIQLFKRQLDIFGKEAAPFFKPFNILKEVYTDGREHFVNDNLSFQQINDDDFLHYQFADREDFEAKYPQIRAWVDRVNQSDEEGVVRMDFAARLDICPGKCFYCRAVAAVVAEVVAHVRGCVAVDFEFGGLAGFFRQGFVFDSGINRVFSHLPVGRPFAADDVHHAGRGDVHFVAA